MTATLEEPKETVPSPARRWVLSWVAVVIALVGFTGLLVFMYPSTAAWWSSYHQSKAIVAMDESIAEDASPGNAERLAQAHRYNELLNAGAIMVGADERKPTTDGTDGADDYVYEDMLPGLDGLMARIKIPSIDVDLPVYHGTSDAVLNKGAGHLQGTALPVGGMGTRSVISAHRGLATATMFNDLDRLAVGDRFIIEVQGDVLTYRVTETQIVEPSDTQSVLPREGEDLVTLITCTPLGINSHRILVTGARTLPTPPEDVKQAGIAPSIPGFPWWIPILTGGVLLAAAYVWRMGYAQARIRNRKNGVTQEFGRAVDPGEQDSWTGPHIPLHRR